MISDDEVRKIAKLANLSVSDQEVGKFSRELSAILEYVEQLQSIDVRNVEPMSHADGSKNIFRKDQVGEALPIEALVSIAPDRSGRFIRVPIIIDQSVEN